MLHVIQKASETHHHKAPEPGREGSKNLEKLQQPCHCYNDTKAAGTKPAMKVPANHSHAENQSRTSCHTSCAHLLNRQSPATSAGHTTAPRLATTILHRVR